MSNHWCNKGNVRVIQYASDSPLILQIESEQEYGITHNLTVDYCPICGYGPDQTRKVVWRGELGLHSEPFMKNMKMYPPNYEFNTIK